MLPVIRCGDTRMWEMYSEYSDIVSCDAPSSRIKARLSALAAFADSQGLTGSAALEGLKRLKNDLSWELMDATRFALFYEFVFFICRDRGQKSLAVTMAVKAWHLVMAGRFQLLDQWCSFVQKNQRFAISEDTWRQFLEFCQTINEDLSNYDPEGAWPVLVDDFVDSLYRNASNPMCNPDFGFDWEASCGENGNERNTECIHNQGTSTLALPHGKKRRSEQQQENFETESINCIAQRLAEMSCPLSCKRLHLSYDVPVAMGEDTEGICVQDMNLDSIEIPKEIGENKPFKFLENMQAASWQWKIPCENRQEMVQSQTYPNLTCNTNFHVTHPLLASYGGQSFGPKY